jgi:acyl-coenzyme A synthetase/AMP-(fatty) acid ligase
MKRAVLCVENPQNYIEQLNEYSIMIVNPNSSQARLNYLLAQSDYSLLITDTGQESRDGKDYGNEKALWYTSGTTGDSKFCSFTQEQINILAAKICKAYNLTSNDRYVSVMSLSHAHGQGFYWATRLAGCETHFLPIQEIRNMSQYSPTFVTAVPDVLKIIGQLKFNDLRFIRSASAALPNKLYQHLEQKYQVPVIEAFGMTEALSHCFTNPLHGQQRMGTVGLPDGIEADVVDGQLYIKGPTLFVNDWYNTGDLADRDDAGYYRILGRSVDQINIRGKKFNPVSLERQLLENIAGLEQCIIFGRDKINCLYVGNCDPMDIRNFLLGLERHLKLTVLQQVDSVPVSPSGKISRSWLDTKY